MHVITYLPNFAPPHFAARGIPKNTPHGTMEDHTAYIYVVCLPLPDGAFSFFSIHKAHILHGLIRGLLEKYPTVFFYANT